MRSFVVTALAAAIVACLALSVSAGGYGGHQQSYIRHQPPQFGYRVFRQRVLLNPGSGGLYGRQAGFGQFGSQYGYGGNALTAGGLVGGAVSTGFNIIWILIIAAIALFILGSL